MRTEFDRLNTGCSFPENVEGYWRQRRECSMDRIRLPWPVPFEVEGYNKYEFVGKLIEKQMDNRVEVISYRGWSINRLTGRENGSTEYKLDGWHWPVGYVSYLIAGVPPSRAFYEFVTGEDIPSLPDYGRI